MKIRENCKYALVCPTSMGVRITPVERQSVHTSHLFEMQATSAESNVLNIAASLGAGAKVLGPVNIGSGSKIAAGAVVLKDVPEDSTAVGIPAKIVRTGGTRVELLDHANIPDPVAKEFAVMKEKIEALEKELDALIKNK